MPESPLLTKSWKKGTRSVDIVYPNKYFGGVYSLGMLIPYNIINLLDGWICNRIFLDKGVLTSKLIGFTFQYEPDYYNFAKILKKSKVSLEKEGRSQIIFAGGPCINANPLTLSKYLDFMIIGESEEIVPKLLGIYEKYGEDKEKFLHEIAKQKGVFVPEISEKADAIFVDDLDRVPYPIYQPLPDSIDKKFVFGASFILEIERGCPFNCKFCLMPKFYEKVKFRSFEKIKEIINNGIKLNKREKVIIYSASFTHPQRKDILKYLISKNLRFSVPSLKVELADKELLQLVKKGGQKSLTVAPECNEKLRLSLRKSFTDEQLFTFLKTAKEEGFSEVKLYLMAALPGQTREDLEETVGLIKKCRETFPKIYVSINPFSPKPQSEFSSYIFDKKAAKEQMFYLKKEFDKLKIRCQTKNVSTAYKEWQLSKATSIDL